MGGGRLAFVNVIFYSLPYDNRLLGVSTAVFTGSGTPARTPTDHCIRSRPTVGIDLLPAGVKSVLH